MKWPYAADWQANEIQEVTKLALILNTAVQHFHWTPQLKTIYHQAKFACKRTVNSEDIVKQAKELLVQKI